MRKMDSKTSEKEPHSTVAKAERKTKDALTVLWDQIPPWMQDNHYIQRGYRPQSNSYRTSAHSITYLHNESVNIWTHLIGAGLAAVAAILMYSVLQPRYKMATREDAMVFSCFFLGCIACLGMSATYHTILNHSNAVARFGQRLDHIGIVILIWGSFVPSIYYGFSGEPGLIRLYWSMITTIGAGTLAAVYLPKFRSSEWRPLRAFMFVAMGLSAVFPVIHGVQMYGMARLQDKIGLSWLVGQGMLYITGAGLYAARIPERWYPGRFDIWGASHQIFHILVVLAAAAHLVGLLKAFDHEHSWRSTIWSSYDQVRKLRP